MKFRPAFLPSHAALHAALVIVTGSHHASASTLYWEGGTIAASQAWNTAGNWSTTSAGDGATAGAVPLSTDDAVFNATVITGARTVTLGGGDRTIRSLTFNSVDGIAFTSGTSGANRLTIGSGGILMNAGAGAVTFGTGVTSGGVTMTLGGSQTWTNNSGSLLWTRNTMTGASGTAVSFTIDGSGNTTLANTISDGASSGTVALIKNGTGVLELGSTNSYSGGTTINAGVIAVGASARLGNAAAALTFGGGTLRATASFTSTRTTTINAGGATYDVPTDLTLTQTAAIGGSGNLTKTGAGLFILSGANSYTGTTTVSGGTLQFNAQSAIYNGDTSKWTTANLSTTGGGLLAVGVGDTQFTSANVATLLASGIFSGGGSLGLSTASASYSLDGAITAPATGVLSISKIGANTLTFSGTLSNTYTGLTTVAAGTLSLGKTGSATAIAGDILVSGGNLSWAGDNQVADAADITVSNTATLNNRTETIHSLSVNGGGFTTGTGSLTAETITLTTVGATRTLLTINGGGTVITRALILAGAANPTGGATGSNLLIGAANGTTLSVGSGGITMSGQNIQINRPASIVEGTPAQIILQGDFTASGTNNIVYGNTSLAANGTLDLGAGNRTFNISDGTTTLGVKVANGGVVKTGGGTLILSDNANSYPGATQVNGGKLLVNGTQTLATGAVSVASGATLGGSGTLGGATTISGIHAAGDDGAIGGQSFSSSLTYTSGSTFSWQLGGQTSAATFDSVVVGGELNISTGAKFNIVVNGLDLDGSFWAMNQTWDVFDAGSTVGNFTAFDLYDSASPDTAVSYGSRGAFSFNPSSGSLQWSVIPEPSNALAGLLVVAGLLRRRRGGCR